MDKASGIYYYLTDESFKVSGSTALDAIVVGISKKGSIKELNTVTAETLEDVLGYDLRYAPNMLGLKNLLEKVSKVSFLRLNVNPYVGNAIIDDTGDLITIPNTTDPNEILTLPNQLAFIHKDPGDWGDRFVKMSPTPMKVALSTASSSFPVSYVFEGHVLSHSQPLVTMPNGTDKKYEAFDIFTADGLTLLAGLKATVETETTFDIYTIGSDGNFTTTKIGTLVEDPVARTVTMNLTSTPGSTNILLSLISGNNTEWTLQYAKFSGESYSILNTVNFSLRIDSEIYIDSVDFGDLMIGGLMSNWNLILPYTNEWIKLLSGDNGTAPTSSADLDLNVMNKTSANILCMNGITNLSVVNAFLSKCSSMYISCFVDGPDFTSYSEMADWAASLKRTEYGQLITVPDIEKVPGIGPIYIWPSLNLLAVYVSMFKNFGTLNYPPAGYSYAGISVTELLDTDFYLYGNELKTSRINYQKVGAKGPVIWEQRTLYGLDTDLSYSSTVFILRDLRSSLISYMENFTFRFTTAQQLLIIESGLKAILESFIADGWLSQYTLKVPSYTEAQAFGREVDIHIGVAVTQDGEVINLRVKLQNAS